MSETNTRYKAIAVAAVMAFILAHIKAYTLSNSLDSNADGLSYIDALAVYSAIYFIFTYALTLIVIRLFLDKPLD